MSKTYRNDPCPCGSGKKYKNCHGSEEKKASKTNYIVIGGIVLILILAFALYQFRDTGTPQPGEAPPGKIWSEEHGHWHDA